MKIGDRTVLISETLLVPDGESAELTHKIADDDFLKMRFVFPQGVENKNAKQPFIKTEYEDEWFVITFANFTSAFGSSTNQLINFALTNNHDPITLMAVIYKLKTFTKLELQIMVEAKS